MQRKLLFKIAAIVLLGLLLLIPLASIEDTIHERSTFRHTARDSIAQSWTGAQQLIGPLLVVPYQIRTVHNVWDADKKQQREQVRHHWANHYVLPDNLKTEGRIHTDIRYRGIYGVPVYTTELTLAGRFSNHAIRELAGSRTDISAWGKPYLSVGLSDSRGIVRQPELTWQQATLPFLPGAKAPVFGQGLHAPLDAIGRADEERFEFRFALALRGMENLSFVPVGLDTEVGLESDWAHPSFLGRFLPEERRVGEDGFGARWRVSSFATDMGRIIGDCNQGDCKQLPSNSFGVSLVDPVDVYLQSERSAKYGLLFIALTFTAFFLFEVLKRLAVHPIQYGLVGLALSFFYLLLIAFSEHIGFGPAYVVGTLACSGLLAWYTGAVLQDRRRGLLFGGVIALLYAMLYVILRSEDHALLMGALLVFSTLAAVMFSTRNLDWYAVGEQMGALKKPQSGTEHVPSAS